MSLQVPVQDQGLGRGLGLGMDQDLIQRLHIITDIKVMDLIYNNTVQVLCRSVIQC